MILPKGLGLMWQCSGAQARRFMAAGIGLRFLQSATLGSAFAVVLAILDDGLGDGRMTIARAWQVTLVMGILLSAHMTFAYLSMRMAWSGAFRAGAQMRHALLDHLDRLPINFHTVRHRGDTVSAMTSDVQLIESFFTDALPQIAQALGMPLVILCFLFARDPALGAVASVVIVVAVPFLFLTGRTIARLGLIRQERQAEAAGAIIEYVRGLVVIRALNRVSSAQSGARGTLSTFRDVSNTLVDRIVWPMVSVGGLLMAGVPLVIFAASFQMDTVSPMTLLVFLVLLLSLYAPLNAILAVMELSRLAEAAFVRTCRILDAAPMAEPENPVMPATFDLRLVDVHGPVLDGINLYAPQHMMTAIIGPSGAGKTTILNLAARFRDVDRGQILIGGVDVRDIGRRNLMDCISVVHQDGWIFSGTIHENITMAHPDATQKQIEVATRAAQAHEFITALPNGYDTIISEDGETLSGGERQRIAIARAILKDAPIILLDEVTSSIDPTHERAITHALTMLAKDKTVLIVAHKISTIVHAGQIITVRNGKIA